MKWPRPRLGHVVTVTKGRRPSNVADDPQKGTSEPYITIEAFETGRPVQYASTDGGEIRTQPGDVVIVWDGARYGLVGRSPGGVLGSTLAVLAPRSQTKGLERDYLFYFLQSKYDQLRSVHRGSGIPHLDGGHLARTPIPLPAVAEQRRIIQVLDQANGLRRLRVEADAKAARILPVLYRRLFGDRASPWPIEPLGRHLRQKRGALQSGPFGSHLHNSDFIEGGPVRVVGIDNVLDGEFVDGRNRRISAAKYKDLKKFTLEEGDVLVTIMGTVGRSCVFPSLDGPAICTKHVYRMQLSESLDPEYVSASIRYSFFVRAQLGASVTGQIVAGITSKDLRRLQVPIPTRDLQNRFARFTRLCRCRADAARRGRARLEATLSVLAHQAFSGSLTASWRQPRMRELRQEMEQQSQVLSQAAP